MGATNLRGIIDACAASFIFLSRIPMPIRPEYTSETNRRSTVFYPFVGLVIGVAVALLAYYLPMLLPDMAAAAIVLIVWVALTGGLHLDGLIDTADGLLSHRSRERKLEIMKDSRVGAMGVIVCVCYLLLKYALIVSVIEMPAVCLLTLWLVPVWSRFFVTASIAWWPYARGDSGMGSLFRGVGGRHVTLAGLIGGVGSCLAFWPLKLLGGFQSSLLEFAVIVAGMLVLTLVAGTIIAAAIARQLGGQSGDTYGAVNELLEVILLLAIVLAGAVMSPG